jgi:hypothetical protein
VFPALLAQVSAALETVTETHQTSAALFALTFVVPVLANREAYPAGAASVLPLLEAALPGFDMNDTEKTGLACGFFACASAALSWGLLDADG